MLISNLSEQTLSLLVYKFIHMDYLELLMNYKPKHFQNNIDTFIHVTRLEF